MRISCLPYAAVAPEVVDRLVGRRFFASPGFAFVWRARGGRAVAWVAEDTRGVAALVPGVEFGRGPLGRFMSMPDGCYGGVAFAPEVAQDRRRIGRLLLEAIRRRSYLKTFLYDFYASIEDAPGFVLQPCATTLVDLSGADWQPPDRKLAAQVRKAEREGVRIERFDWRLHGTRFLRLQESSERRHGRAPKYPAAFFEALAELADRDPRVHWVWCESDGSAASSHIYFLEDGTLQAWQTYFDRAFSFLKANQYIRFTVCREMAGLGVRRLNLGATPDGASGLAYYKQRWGGYSSPYRAYVRRVGLGGLL